MLLDDYYSIYEGTIHVSPKQASDFAKKIAGDFNPLHNEDAKRFCVPGDLLFALVLNNYGLSQHMNFTFSGMVGSGVDLVFPQAGNGPITISDNNGKDYLSIERDGETSTDPELIQNLIRHYVEFSGQTFPHILIPLMAEHKVMINPDRPLVIYESMAINIDRLDIKDPQLELTHTTLDIDGKRGRVCLEFCLKTGNEVVGGGKKNMVLSGLREFDQATIDQLVNDYAARKNAYIR